jgi:hypothetical protein
VFTEPLPSNVWERDMQTHKQQGGLISLLLFIQNNESRLKINHRLPQTVSPADETSPQSLFFQLKTN